MGIWIWVACRRARAVVETGDVGRGVLGAPEAGIGVVDGASVVVGRIAVMLLK